jgi:hypothetical protein
VTCACCETVACCTGAACNSVTRSQCVGPFNGTPNTVVGTCDPFVCLDVSGKQSCSLVNACACAATSSDHRTRPTVQPPTCNCTTLSSLGFTAGGCRWYLCEQCVSGNCANQCAFPRECCAGTCCPLSQKCVGTTCVDKCETGTFCAGTGSNFNCCGPNTKCCGASGCLPLGTASANFSVDVAVDGWVNTGLTIPAGATVTINAGGSVQWRLPTRDNIGPSGTDGYPTDGPCNPLQGVAHMSLIGRVGGSMFSVGASYSGQPGSGLLELRQNDSCTADNEGFYTGTASWSGDPCPGFTPASSGEPVVHGVPLPPGPGAALKDILKLGGIVASETCSCNARAAKMDEWGGGECIQRCAEIVGWLKEEAEKRGMWFCRPVGYALVLAAVLLSALKRLLPGNNK